MKISILTKELIKASGKNQTEISNNLKNVDRRFISRIVTGQSECIQKLDLIFEELLPGITAEMVLKSIELIRSTREIKP